MTIGWQCDEQVYHCEVTDGEGKKTPEGLLEGDRMFDEGITSVGQSCIANILLEQLNDEGGAIEGILDDSPQRRSG